MTKRIVFGVAAVAIAVLLMAPSASASCLGIRNATTFGSATAYWHPASVPGTPTGQTWQLGSPGSWSTGNCNTNSPGVGGAFVYFSAGGANLNLDLAACGLGCPASGSTLVVLAQNKTATGTEFLLDTIVETPLNPSANFDYGSQGDHTMIPIPRPRVLSSSRVLSDVNLSVAIDAITPGLFGPNAASAVSGFRILTKSSATDPGRDASSYDAVPAAVVSNPGGTGATQPVTVACPDLQDRWLAVQIQFEGGVVLGDAVGAATQIRCDPALANPKYKIVPKKIGSPRTVPN